MATAYIGLGSNLGDRWAALQSAIRRLRAEPGLRVLAISHIYDSIPLDCPPGSGDYLNAAVAVETDRSPADLLKLLHHIERQFGRGQRLGGTVLPAGAGGSAPAGSTVPPERGGRIRSEINAPRTLDLDLLLYGDSVLDTPELVVPHPRMHERAFVLVPLEHIAPEVAHPILKQTVCELLVGVNRDGVKLAPQPLRTTPGPLAGLRCLVTGSTSGIGRAIVEAFTEQGADVITHGRHSLGERSISADLRDASECDRLAAQSWEMFGGLDVLVLNAGADTLTGEAAKWSFDEKLEALLAVDLKATMRLARNLGELMKERGRGSIITIGWDQAETGMEGDSGQLFGAVKSAVMGFTRSLALSLAPEVRMNCIAPGWIRTAWGETASAYWQERVRRETPLGIWGLPENVATAAVWLSSSAASFITGQTIRVNGGVR